MSRKGTGGIPSLSNGESLWVTPCCHFPRSPQQLAMLPCTIAGTCQELSFDNNGTEWLLLPFHMRESQCSNRPVTPVPICFLSISGDQGLFRHPVAPMAFSPACNQLSSSTCLSSFISHCPPVLFPSSVLSRNKLFFLGLRHIRNPIPFSDIYPNCQPMLVKKVKSSQ